MTDEETITRTAATPAGPVEIETVRCDCCDQEVHEDDAKEFVIADTVYEKNSGRNWRVWEFDWDDPRLGLICPYCADAGFVTGDSTGDSTDDESGGYTVADWLIVVFELAFVASFILLASGLIAPGVWLCGLALGGTITWAFGGAER